MAWRSISQKEIDDILDSDASDVEEVDNPPIYQKCGDMLEGVSGTPSTSQASQGSSISPVSFYATSDTSDSTGPSPVSVRKKVKARPTTKKPRALPQESDEEHDDSDPTWHPIASSSSSSTHVKVKGKGQSVQVQTYVVPTPSSPSISVSVVTSVPLQELQVIIR